MELVGSYFPEQPGIESKLPAVKVLSPNHWTSREFSRLHFKVLIAKKKKRERIKYYNLQLPPIAHGGFQIPIVAIWPPNPP